MLFGKISKHFGGDLKGKTIAIWGLAFKPDTDDMREAPSRVLLEAALEARARTCARYDPAAMKETQRIFGERADLTLVQSSARNARGRRRARDRHRVAGVPQPGLRQSQEAAQDAGDLRRPQPLRPGVMKKQGFTYYAIGRGEA